MEEGPRGRLAAASKKRLDEAYDAALAAGKVPLCGDGHGPLDVHLSRRGGLYWRCAYPGCESWEWYREYSSEKCPRCGEPMERVPSKKVTGGNFLKCHNVKVHTDEVLMFRNRESGGWEQPVDQLDTSKLALRRNAHLEVPPPKIPELGAEQMTRVLKIMSAVARLNGLPGGKRPGPAVDRAAILAHLRGEGSVREDLPTFGAVADLASEEFERWAEALIDADWLRYSPSTDGFVLTAGGVCFLKERGPARKHGEDAAQS